MPTKPPVTNLTSSSADILNTIRDNATEMYSNAVPMAIAGDRDSLKTIGAVIMQNPNFQNEFLNALANRIARVLVTSKLYSNPWAIFKKGLIEFGETIEEVFVNIAKPFTFDPEKAETNQFKREIPDVRARFHVMNYQKFYKATVSNDQLRQAFLSWDGITDLIARIVDSMYTAANYDEFQTMKYMLARNILDGQMFPVTIPTVTPENSRGIVSVVKGVSNDLEFLNDKFNLAGVSTYSNKDNQFVIVNTKFDAVMDVEVLATSFNMDKAQFMGHRVLIDGFGKLDIPRLTELFKDDTTFNPPTKAELDALDNIPAIIVDRDYFMVFDNFVNFTEKYNGEGLYWNYWYHLWKTFSMSPFANNAIFVPGTPKVTSVSVSPETATVMKGNTLQMSATVVTEQYAPKSVTWSINSDLSSISPSGLLKVSKDETATIITVTATSVFDNTKTDTATVTVG